MGEFILNGRNYGGSIITPNPSDTPTDSLDSVKIGDTTYKIQGGGGGGLQYFIESENALYGINDDAQYMREDPKFRHTAPAVFTCYLQRNQPSSGYAVHTCPNVDYNDIVGIRGSQFAPLFGRVGGDGIFIISKDPTHCYFTVEEWDGKTYPQTGAPDYSDSYSYSTTHNVKTQLNVRQASNSGAISDTFTFNGETYYIVIDGQSWNWWTLATEIETEYKWFSFNEGEYPSVEDYYQTVGEYGLKVMQAYKASQKYNGISRDDGLAFFAGASDEQGTNAPIKIFDDGTAEGLATTADLTLKQDKLIAGDNISIGSDGKTINAKVYANPTDTATEAMTKLTVGDTTYEIQGGGSSLILDAQRYSLDEQVVGIWTDGKPLYQRTWEFSSSVSLSANTWFTSSIPNTNMERIVNAEAMSETGTRWAISGACDVGSYVNLICFRNSTITVKYVTLQYTKTTDIAGSGGYQAYGFSPIVCSDTEREVGVWEDNKPLYQKTFIDTLGGTAGSDVSNYKMADLSDIDTIVSISGTLQGITPINSYYASDNYNMVFVNGAKNGLYCNGKNIGGNTYKVTIQYTKASDTAGSGEYNTLAIPNVYYDNTERVIGTWFGETLYQRSYYIGTLTVDTSWHPIAHGISNFKKLVDLSGCITNSPDGRMYNIPHYRPSSDAGISFGVDTTNIYYMNNWLDNNEDAYVTIQYTKTT